MNRLVPPQKKYLWKFLDLYKFISFLKTRKIFFSRIDTFDDDLEMVSEQMAFDMRMDRQTAEMIESHRNPNIPPEEFLKRTELFIKRLNTIKYWQRKFSASCFYESDSESVAMWKLYSGENGVAIKFDAMKLFESIKSNFHKSLLSDYNLSAAPINYVNLFDNSCYDEEANPKKLDQAHRLFRKDRSYEHEREYRFMLNKKGEITDIESFGLEIDFNQSIEGFTVTPETEDWKIEMLISVLKENNCNVNISKSAIVTKQLVNSYKLKLFEKLNSDQKMPGRSAIMYF